MQHIESFYIDQRGWTYRVMPGVGHCFKARLRRQGPYIKSKWRCLAALPWRETREEAEADLQEYAKLKKMTYIRFDRNPSNGLLTAYAVKAIERKENHG